MILWKPGIEAAKISYKSKGAFWGLHLEGPLPESCKKRCPSRKIYQKSYPGRSLKAGLEQADGVIKMITIAP
jgi:N-acetylglucosamine-6-phosphate deacetylase